MSKQTERPTSKLLFAAVALLALAACRQPQFAMADGRVLYDKEGCAFFVRQNVGDTSFVGRLSDADLSGCNLPATPGAP